MIQVWLNFPRAMNKVVAIVHHPYNGLHGRERARRKMLCRMRATWPLAARCSDSKTVGEVQMPHPRIRQKCGVWKPIWLRWAPSQNQNWESENKRRHTWEARKQLGARNGQVGTSDCSHGGFEAMDALVTALVRTLSNKFEKLIQKHFHPKTISF